MQQILCPQCGAPVKFQSAASVMAVCGACRSTLLKDADAVRRIGTMSEVLEDYSPIQIGTTGRFEGKRFDVVGRLQLRYDDGFWNEWYLWFDDGQGGWLSDASGQYAVTRACDATKISSRLPTFGDIQPGQTLSLRGRLFAAADVRTCRSTGGQGELPFAVGEAGWEARVADYRAADQFLTLDYSDGDTPAVYLGKAIGLDALQRGSLRPAHLIEETAGVFQGRIQALDCPNCGAPISFAAALATQVNCPSCQAVVDCSGDTAIVIAKQRKVAAFKTTLALGEKAVIDGVAYTLIGLMRCTDSDPEKPYVWIEYLLHSPQAGFLWLVETDDGWSRARVCDRWPLLPKTGNTVLLNDRRYTRKEEYTSTVQVALGAFNWRVRQGYTSRVTDYAAGNGKAPNMLTREQTDSELGWSASDDIQPAQLAEWFKRPELAKAGRKTRATRVTSGNSNLTGPAWIASLALLFMNSGNLFGSGFIRVLLGLFFIWMPLVALRLLWKGSKP
ncbi:DUF4178 domain-containing protein [Chitinasiproducens palmae]|uniref:DUF4178 domain-containing protein n=1 Tax=Chitinasiproducens palmae TaxID=1770053 RepID=A0A1H2PNA4_9BURK|nr:DUF4178 domain-containing protein [Chitinasiproducens palmae]SDV47269.1 protein of unknown function [Chitinasiproducens palmae]